MLFRKRKNLEILNIDFYDVTASELYERKTKDYSWRKYMKEMKMKIINTIYFCFYKHNYNVCIFQKLWIA